MLTESPLVMGLAAILLTACAMVLGTPEDDPLPGLSLRSAPAAAPFSCVLRAQQAGGSVSLRGEVTARAALAGHYTLRIRGTGVTVDQSGPFAIGPGETARLGAATLPGRVSHYDTSLIVEAGGRRHACPLVAS
ncbi:curli-like amyloid fiber formation chaperone CsgH [Rubellimicrobium sp. CFH 75288]|uniref:curli-like amyloid fiber formation chaperone CsgH n=1 Tax=Rubellimicrobium sp. CFH 75288 TaxID=2697034 RepID=UPI001412EDD8|nr:curli-like amyloid fiber formation chaperone CsgH [Rubellimicrobium sp. CFH 75288]NAZ37107.1 hypothetical protein [Rubellimicrobium sp. CFH 75288]